MEFFTHTFYYYIAVYIHSDIFTATGKEMIFVLLCFDLVVRKPFK